MRFSQDNSSPACKGETMKSTLLFGSILRTKANAMTHNPVVALPTPIHCPTPSTAERTVEKSSRRMVLARSSKRFSESQLDRQSSSSSNRWAGSIIRSRRCALYSHSGMEFYGITSVLHSCFIQHLRVLFFHSCTIPTVKCNTDPLPAIHCKTLYTSSNSLQNPIHLQQFTTKPYTPPAIHCKTLYTSSNSLQKPTHAQQLNTKKKHTYKLQS